MLSTFLMISFVVVVGRNTGKKAGDEKRVVILQVPKGSLPSPSSSVPPLATLGIEERMAEAMVAEIALGAGEEGGMSRYLPFCDQLGILCYGFNFTFDTRHSSFLLLNRGITHFIISTVQLTACLMLCFVLMEEVVGLNL